MQNERENSMLKFFKAVNLCKDTWSRNSAWRISRVEQPCCCGNFADSVVIRESEKSVGQILEDIFSPTAMAVVNNRREETDVDGPCTVVSKGKKKKEFTSRNGSVKVKGNEECEHCQCESQNVFHSRGNVVARRNADCRSSAEKKKYNCAEATEVYGIKRYAKLIFRDGNWKFLALSFTGNAAVSAFIIWLARESALFHGMFPSISSATRFFLAVYFLWIPVAFSIQSVMAVLYQLVTNIFGVTQDYCLAYVLHVILPFFWPVFLCFYCGGLPGGLFMLKDMIVLTEIPFLGVFLTVLLGRELFRWLEETFHWLYI